MSNNNPNNITAKFYDISSSNFKGEDLVTEELDLIQKNCKQGGSILDIGCGTGRHLLPLVKNGYSLTGIDASKGMLNELKKKGGAKANLIQDDFRKFNFHLEQHFDLIIMFWNTFNEICLTGEDALNVLNKCKQLLSPGGKIIINSDNRDDVDNNLFDFSNKDILDGSEIEYSWETLETDKSTNTTTSKESIHVMTDETQKKVKEIFETIIIQRWWTLEEYKAFAKTTNLSIVIAEIIQNNELYLVLTPYENE